MILKKGQNKRIILFGCGGHARSIINSIVEIDNNIKIIMVDKAARDHEYIMNYPVYKSYCIGNMDYYMIGIGDNIERKLLYETLQREAAEMISVVSLTAQIGIGVQVGMGTFVGNYAYVGPEVSIGNGSIVNTSSILEHEVKIGNFSHIAPGAIVCGRTKIGDNVFCGAHSTIIDGINICNNVVIGAGAVVVKSINIPGVYMGVPAKRYNN